MVERLYGSSTGVSVADAPTAVVNLRSVTSNSVCAAANSEATLITSGSLSATHTNQRHLPPNSRAFIFILFFSPEQKSIDINDKINFAFVCFVFFFLVFFGRRVSVFLQRDVALPLLNTLSSTAPSSGPFDETAASLSFFFLSFFLPFLT